jgi:hypothetical protein
MIIEPSDRDVTSMSRTNQSIFLKGAFDTSVGMLMSDVSFTVALPVRAGLNPFFGLAHWGLPRIIASQWKVTERMRRLSISKLAR